MNNDIFNQVIKETHSIVDHLLENKGEEYATGSDRLHNFNAGAGVTGKHPEAVLFGFVLKHIISLSDMINDLEKGYSYPQCVWEEKVMDIITYMYLLRAIRADSTGVAMEPVDPIPVRPMGVR